MTIWNPFKKILGKADVLQPKVDTTASAKLSTRFSSFCCTLYNVVTMLVFLLLTFSELQFYLDGAENFQSYVAVAQELPGSLQFKWRQWRRNGRYPIDAKANLTIELWRIEDFGEHVFWLAVFFYLLVVHPPWVLTVEQLARPRVGRPGGWLGRKSVLFLHGLNLGMLTAMATMVITIPDLLMVTKVIYLIVSITLVFKLMSYSNVNRELRAAWLLRWRVAKVVGGAKTMLDELARHATAHWGSGDVETYPKNVTWKNFVCFCYLSPFLSYQASRSSCFWSGEIVRELVRAGANKKATSGGHLRGKTALHYAVGMGFADIARELLREGYLETATDDDGCRPGCLIGKAWTEQDPVKDHWMRRLLTLGPALRACSWLWPTEMSADTAASGAAGKRGKVSKGVKKGENGSKRAPIDLSVLLRPRRSKDAVKRRKDTMKTIARYANMKNGEFLTECACAFCGERS